MIERGRIHEGMAVYSADGEKLGKVISSDESTFIIEKGFFFPKDYVARLDDVSAIMGDEIHLSRGRDALAEPGEARREGTSDAPIAAQGREDIRVPVVEEEVDVAKRMKDAGEVRLRKDVTTETKHIEVPVVREEVHAERVPADEARAAMPGEGTFEQRTLSMPVREEEVDIRKRPVVKEEVRLRKERLVEQRAADTDVRREQVRVEGEGTHGEDLQRHLDADENLREGTGIGEDTLDPTRRDPDDE